MKTIISSGAVVLWLSARDTHDWANKPGTSWPCSKLSGRRFAAEFDREGLSDIIIDGGKGSQDVDITELNAICSDHLAKVLPKDHPAYFVAVGQFHKETKA